MSDNASSSEKRKLNPDRSPFHFGDEKHQWLIWLHQKCTDFIRRWKSLLGNQRTITFAIALLSAYYIRSRQRMRRLSSQDAVTIVPISILWKALQEKLLTKVLLGSQSIRFQSSKSGGTQWHQVQLPPQHSLLHKELISRLTSASDVDLSLLPETDWSSMTTLLFAALPFCYLAFVYRIMTNLQQNPHSENETDTSMLHDHASRPPVSFADVAGLDGAVADLRDILRLQQQSHWATMPRGILLQGPPGTGKTLLARALAHEWPGPFYHVSASSFVEVYVGRGAARVRALFRQARSVHREPWRSALWSSAAARPRDSSGPGAIIFIDELDALAKTRSSTSFGSNDEREQTLNQLLTEMDGFSGRSSERVLMLGATNRADVLDPAIVRRFDRTIAVELPDAAGRVQILQIHARHLSLDAAIDWARLAQETTGYSGSDLRHLVQDAVRYASRVADPYVVTQQHLEAAIQRRRPRTTRR